MTPDNNSSRKKLILATLIYALLLLLLVFVSNLTKINTWLDGIRMLLRPITWGLVLAYFLNPIFRMFEHRALVKIRSLKFRRALSLLLTYLTLLLVLLLFVSLIIPQFYSSLTDFLDNFDRYMHSAVVQINGMTDRINAFLMDLGIEQAHIPPLEENSLQFSNVVLNFSHIMEWVLGLLGGGESFSLEALLGTLGNLFGLIADAIFAFFISLYFLSTKELRYAQVMKVRHALFDDKVNDTITRLCTAADKSFGGFVEGKLLDALIVGVLTYIVSAIFGIPYASLIAAFIGFANVIPLVGPVIGAIPTSVIVLLTNPSKFIPFLIIVIAIQLIDANIITPKILGSNTGVSSLCVLISITTVGSLWGFTGMLLAVPIFATVIDLTSGNMENRLRAKGLPSTTENYYPANSMVDPAVDVRSNTDKITKAIERKYLCLKKKSERGEELTRSERMHVSFYKLCRRMHIIGEMSDEILTQFTAEEAAKAARAEVECLIKEENGADLLDK